MLEKDSLKSEGVNGLELKSVSSRAVLLRRGRRSTKLAFPRVSFGE